MSGSKTLCDWEGKHIEKKFSELSQLVNKPNYICRKCARAGNSKDILCKPQKIKK